MARATAAPPYWAARVPSPRAPAGGRRAACGWLPLRTGCRHQVACGRDRSHARPRCAPWMANRSACALVTRRRSRPRPAWCSRAPVPLVRWLSACAGHSGWKAMAAELTVLLKAPAQKIWPAADHGPSPRIDGRKRPHRHAVCRRGGGRAGCPPLRSTVVAPRFGTHAASAKRWSTAAAARVAKLAVGALASPVLVASGEDDRTAPRRHDRDPRRGQPQSPRPCSRSRALDAPSGPSIPNADPA